MSYAHRETLRKMSDETVAKAMNLAAAADDPVAAVIAAQTHVQALQAQVLASTLEDRVVAVCEELEQIRDVLQMMLDEHASARNELRAIHDQVHSVADCINKRPGKK